MGSASKVNISAKHSLASFGKRQDRNGRSAPRLATKRAWIKTVISATFENNI